jgi:cellulose synthase operon protein YhjQ
MSIIALQGLRGGTGATAITAALSWALHALGESVLAVDLSPVNQLRIHFNMPVQHTRGWALSAAVDENWRQGAMRYHPGLDFVPFGLLNDKQHQRYLLNTSAWQQPMIDDLVALKARYRWILFDVPAEADATFAPLLAQCDCQLRILTADANCHLRLHQSNFADNSRFLINHFNAGSLLQQDLHQLWIDSLRNLIPLILHRDEAMAEALLNKQAVGEYRPGSLIAEEVVTLANWLLLHVQEKVA